MSALSETAQQLLNVKASLDRAITMIDTLNETMSGLPPRVRGAYGGQDHLTSRGVVIVANLMGMVSYLSGAAERGELVRKELQIEIGKLGVPRSGS